MLYRITSLKESGNSHECVCKEAVFVNKGEAFLPFTINGLRHADFLEFVRNVQNINFQDSFRQFFWLVTFN